jgi:hypothetical protein
MNTKVTRPKAKILKLEISNDPFCRCHQGSVAETQRAKKLANIARASNLPPNIDVANAIKPKLRMSGDATDSPVISITTIVAKARPTAFQKHKLDEWEARCVPLFSVTH